MGVEEPEPCTLVTVLLTRGGEALDPGTVVGVPLEEEEDNTTVEEGVEIAADEDEEDEEGVTEWEAEELGVP